ncbi:MAG: pyridoxamine 5'-phosphate oxidase family protein [Chloroflexota bacterium]|nr:pyridoxamine 5'-phosphate oxidase family protein [Chloroflexota bacterium]
MARLSLDDVLPLLEAPSPAALAVYRADGSVHLSPVWYRWTADRAFEVVIAPGDGKLTHLESDRRVSLLIFEAVPPFRGVEVRGVADLRTDGVADARLAIASRYLGTAGGKALVARRGDRGVVLSLRPVDSRVWDLSELGSPHLDDQPPNSPSTTG